MTAGDSRVAYFLSLDWVVDDDEARTEENFRQLLAEVESPRELHGMVAVFNWDCGAEDLRPILMHPKCDVATVLLAYWRACPGYFCQYTSEEDIPKGGERDQWEFLKFAHALLDQRLSVPSAVHFDPKNDPTAGGYDWTSDYKHERSQHGFYSIPETFKQAV